MQDEASRRQQLAEEAREVNTMWTSAAQLSAAVDLLQNTTASILQSEKHAMLLATATELHEQHEAKELKLRKQLEEMNEVSQWSLVRLFILFV